MSFLDKVEPLILSHDKTLRSFALQVIDKGYLGTEQTFFYAMQAVDQQPIHPLKNSVIPYVRNIPYTNRMVKELIERLQRKDGNQIWYASLIEEVETELLLAYQDQLAPFINQDVLASYLSLLNMDEGQLLKEADSLISELESMGYHQSLFRFGKRIYKEVLKRITLSQSEIESVILENVEKEYFSYKGIFYVYLAGEQKVTALVPLLSSLLERTSEDLLLEEVTKALLKIGSEEVIQQVEKYLVDLDTAYSAVEILENIKLLPAEGVLLEHFEKTQDITVKTMIADALCKQLSTKAIPSIAHFVEEGYDQGLLNLKEPLYVCCVINNIDHPKIEEWKQSILYEEARMEKRQKEITRATVQSQKVGRNNPCPCGSGKKFKKCCGK
ncbi:SEC-C metal-binding domain-containing protein [Pseudalkalibacillus caeni]|uniref:Zinc chelation protein SecC n=1 Tax=Exobacillus caeni TaxID=2574798 RepID=A0A5R9FDG3_9BACL|nr:SEC-C metal-binding domain-containing protein [Pseudalkalibacillus caeni]TLS38604.1 hypothetical protein FCL54_03640 [Pseudalkalibacillus caeni]